MDRVLEKLIALQEKDDRGMMASLRCILVDNKKHRAWPALHRLGVPIYNETLAFVAGLFATHPDNTSKGNMGVTCKEIEKARKETVDESNKLTPTERRFQILLGSEREEIHARVLRMVIMAKAKGIPVNYERLLNDIKFWNERTKMEWGASFWAQGNNKSPQGGQTT